jgi:hypothetical protein
VYRNEMNGKADVGDLKAPPCGRRAAWMPWRAYQSLSVRKTWATFPVIVARSASSAGSAVASPWIQRTPPRLIFQLRDLE